MNQPRFGQYRVIRRHVETIEYGYIEPTITTYNVLQTYRKTGFLRSRLGWIDVDKEEVPAHVMISIGCFGTDSSGWTTKFKDYIQHF